MTDKTASPLTDTAFIGMVAFGVTLLLFGALALMVGGPTLKRGMTVLTTERKASNPENDCLAKGGLYAVTRKVWVTLPKPAREVRYYACVMPVDPAPQ